MISGVYRRLWVLWGSCNSRSEVLEVITTLQRKFTRGSSPEEVEGEKCART
jgi:hypothetical protein